MKRAVVLIVVVAMLLVIAAAIILVPMTRSGLSTHEEPTAIEAFAARTVRRWAVPSDLRGVENPMPPSLAVLAGGRAHFADHCAGCHGNDGKGGGMGKQMYPRAPDMTLAATQSLSDGELFAVIENGVRLTGMPGFGSGTAESAVGTWGLVHFIRHLPALTPEEITEMEKLNPKTPDEYEAMKAEQEFLGGGEAVVATTTAGHRH